MQAVSLSKPYAGTAQDRQGAGWQKRQARPKRWLTCLFEIEFMINKKKGMDLSPDEFLFAKNIY